MKLDDMKAIVSEDDEEFAEKFREAYVTVKKMPGVCMEPECELPKVKPSHRCAWHLEAKMPPDKRAEVAAERRMSWDGTRTRADGSCAGCGAPDVPAWYVSGSRCKSCAVLDRRTSAWGLSTEQQQAIAKISNGLCMGCERAQTFKALAVDHNHDTGEIRGLLCQECNGLIGDIFDNPARLIRLAAYLLNPPARIVLNPDKALSDKETAREIVNILKEIFNADS